MAFFSLALSWLCAANAVRFALAVSGPNIPFLNFEDQKLHVEPAFVPERTSAQLYRDILEYFVPMEDEKDDVREDFFALRGDAGSRLPLPRNHTARSLLQSVVEGTGDGVASGDKASFILRFEHLSSNKYEQAKELINHAVLTVFWKTKARSISMPHLQVHLPWRTTQT